MRAVLSRRVLTLVSVPAVIAGIALASPSFGVSAVTTHSSYGYGRNINSTLCEYNSFDLDQNGSQTVRTQGLGGSVQAVAGGTGFALYLMDNGTVKGCGKDAAGELGDGGAGQGGYRNNPVSVGNLTSIVAIAASDDNGYALDSTGHVYAWGSSNFGQIGDGSTQFTNPEGFVGFPKLITALSGIQQIAAGGLFAMARDSGGNVWTWGNNQTGELGRTGTLDRTNSDPTPAQVTLSGITAIAANNNGGNGHDSAFAVTGGDVYSWGNNLYGQLGLGDQVDRSAPTKVTAPFGVASEQAVSVASGLYSTFVLTDTADVYGFGSDINGSLGNGAGGDSFSPIDLGLENVTQVAASPSAALALFSDNTYAEWGTAIPFNTAKREPGRAAITGGCHLGRRDGRRLALRSCEGREQRRCHAGQPVRTQRAGRRS